MRENYDLINVNIGEIIAKNLCIPLPVMIVIGNSYLVINAH